MSVAELIAICSFALELVRFCYVIYADAKKHREHKDDSDER